MNPVKLFSNINCHFNIQLISLSLINKMVYHHHLHLPTAATKNSTRLPKSVTTDFTTASFKMKLLLDDDKVLKSQETSLTSSTGEYQNVIRPASRLSDILLSIAASMELICFNTQQEQINQTDGNGHPEDYCYSSCLII